MKHSTFNSFIFFSFFESLQPVLVISSLFFFSVGFSTSDIFLLKAIFLFSVFIFDIPGGLALDHIGPKFTLNTAKIFEIFGLLTLLFTKNILFISLAMILMGVSLALVSGARAAISKILESNTGVNHKTNLAYANFAMLASYSLTLIITGFAKFQSGQTILIVVQILSCLLTIYFIGQIPNRESIVELSNSSKFSLKNIFSRNLDSSIFIFGFYVAIIRILVELLPISLKIFTVDSIFLGFLLAGFALSMALSSWAYATDRIRIFRKRTIMQIFSVALLSTLLLAPTSRIFVFCGLLLFVFVRTLGDVLIPSAVITTFSNKNSNATRLSIANCMGAGFAAIISYIISLFSNETYMFFFVSFLVGIFCIVMFFKKGAHSV